MEVPRKAFWWTIAVLTPLGWGLDFLFANRFFEFKNTAATLRVARASVAEGCRRGRRLDLTGSPCVLLLYIWLDEYWMVVTTWPTTASGAATSR